MATPNQAHNGGGVYKRASRKGAPRRFPCDYTGCDKIYSRAEHLQRHQLNHSPKEIFRCDVVGCEQKFVRADLLARHKKRHSASYIPRNRAPSFSTGPSPKIDPTGAGGAPPSTPPVPGSSSGHGSVVTSGAGASTGAPGTGGRGGPASNATARAPPGAPGSRPPYPRGPHDAGILLSPDSTGQQSRITSWPRPSVENVMRSKPDSAAAAATSFYGRDAAGTVPDRGPVIPFTGVPFQPDQPMSRDNNFAVWLFDPQASFSEFPVSNIPFLEGGLESPFNTNINYDYESLTSRSQIDLTPPRQLDMSDELMTEIRRQEILHWFQVFRRRQPKYEEVIASLVHESGGDLPALNLEMMKDCLAEFWENVSPRMPIVHQPTFSCNRCSIFLLMVMIALGSASLRARDTTGNLSDHGGFADVIIDGVRWEILPSDDAQPPVALWVAQALLLLEFHEKMYSSRRFHERSHIYHSATLTLLRRGSPLIGRSGSESPPNEQAGSDQAQNSGLDSRTWWIRWAETEAMHRAVFVAFMMDVIHAAMFGHTADMAPHEIRLPLPCDDNLWTASSPDVVRNLDANFRMYGVKSISFLDGLKRALHGQEVRTHLFGRMIIMSGLLSVGWHLSHRETHLKWLEFASPSPEMQDKWRQMLLRAFDIWKDSFDGAIGSDSMSESGAQRSGANGPIHSASVLYHLAHISLHVDIVDCQVYAGAKRLLGRKVSSRDYENVVKRMKTWAHQNSTRHAVLHAFKLLYRVLLDPRPKKRQAGFVQPPQSTPLTIQYSIRSEPDPHRPWIMYYAVLSIWSYVQAIGGQSIRVPPQTTAATQGEADRKVAEYLRDAAIREDLDPKTVAGLREGLPRFLDLLQGILEDSHSELLKEARRRLMVCRDILTGRVKKNPLAHPDARSWDM
ncbi:zinc CHH2 type domain containing protein [Zalerion maritima]|uniref:Zinc CHH2 type domain containing protein n=1 Tax=Zalerion maritima TaxID=339359 RepID=A0AAD5RW06_9PEZI|nr:zinc CHH2 type domain containing protein [Zalerion maritima]